MKANEKRNPHTYKCTDKVYSDAMKRAKKEKVPLANMIEEIVEAYADGAFTIHFTKKV